MGIQDLFITPVYIIILSILAFIVRPYVTTPENVRYFMPALWVRFMGALMLGLIYQFYYDGGDTFNYFTHGSRWIWEAFLEDPALGLKLLFEEGGNRQPETFRYSQFIWYYRDVKSYTIVRIVAFFGLFTLHTYSAIALLFAFFSFSGLWAMYSALYKRYKHLKYLHLGILFIPSVVFWGSGILKDTVTIGALGWLTWALFHVFELRTKVTLALIVMICSTLVILQIKSYIVVLFIPTVCTWLYLKSIKSLQNTLIKVVALPFIVFSFGAFVYLSSSFISNDEYNIENFAQKAAVTAYDIRYGWGARTAGDGGYDIGMSDGTLPGTLRLFPAAVNVSLFRPYLWEVRNPLMLLSALESLFVTLMVINIVASGKWRTVSRDPFLVFCFVFVVLFAFAVGVSTFNFGTLIRYKIPLVPFLGVILCQARPAKGRMAKTEQLSF